MSADVKRDKVTALVEELKGSSAAQKRLLDEIGIVKEHMQSNSGAVKDSYNVLQGSLQPLLKELNTKNLVLDKLLVELEDKRDLVQILRRDLTAAEESAKNAQKATSVATSVSTSQELLHCSREQLMDRLQEAESAASNNFKVAEDTQQRLYSVNNEILRMKDKQLSVGVLREGLTDQANYIVDLQGELKAMKKRFQKAREVAVAQEKVIIAMEKQDKESQPTLPEPSTPASKEASAVIGALRMKLATLQQKEKEMQDRSRETEEEWSQKNQNLITQIGNLNDSESQTQILRDSVTEGLLSLASELDLHVSAQQTFRQSSPSEQIDVLISLVRTSSAAINREKYKTAVDLSISTNDSVVGVLKAARDRYNQISNKIRILQKDSDIKNTEHGSAAAERERNLRAQSLKDVREIERLKAHVQRLSANEERADSPNGRSNSVLSRELDASKLNISILEQQSVERERASAQEVSQLKLQLSEQRALVMSLKPPSPAPVSDIRDPPRRKSVTLSNTPVLNPVGAKKKLEPIVPKHRFQS